VPVKRLEPHFDRPLQGPDVVAREGIDFVAR
jgi:hypothetical protein